MKRTVMERARSPWEERDADGVRRLLPPGCGVLRVWERRVGDGTLACIVAHEPLGPQREPRWHMSISHRSHSGALTRYPRWDEIADARYKLAPLDIEMIMVLPPPEEFINLHSTTFQLHEAPRVP